MGNVVSFLDCGLSRFLTDTHPEIELGPGGIQTTHEEAVRQQRLREENITQEVAQRERRCSELEDEIADLEAQAASQHSKLLRNNPASAQYKSARGIALRAMNAAQMKKKELAKQSKMVELGHGVLHRVRMIDGSSTDQEYVEQLRLYTTAIDPEQHAARLEEFSQAATDTVDNADALHELEEVAMKHVEALEFSPVDLTEDSSASTAGSDTELIKALGLLAAGRGEQNAEPELFASSSSSVPMQPIYPEVPSEHTPQRRTAMAFDANGKASPHDVSRRKTAQSKEKDQFATIFW
jgi:glutamyl/glutaminyl-tRNA synthetase